MRSPIAGLLAAVLAALLVMLAAPRPASALAVNVIPITGQLLIGGAPVTGNYDLTFQLYSAVTGGATVGPLVTVTNVAVADGVYYVEANFGALSLGNPLFVQTSYRHAGTGSYTALTPRHTVPSVVYAAYTPYASFAGNTNTIAGQHLKTTVPATGQALIFTGGFWTPTALPAPTAPLTLSASSFAPILSATNTNASGGNGIYGSSASETGVYGVNTGSGDYGMLGGAETLSGSSYPAGVFGYDTSNEHYGVYGYSGDGYAVYGRSGTGDGVYGVSDSGSAVVGATNSGTAGLFFGNVIVEGDLSIVGTLTKGGGSFKIDSPLHPATEFLSHSFVESPDMMNIYNGNVRTDAHGRATVKMPAYFGALNQDFRYVLTCIGGFAPVYIARGIHGNAFQIAGGKPGMKVSWQVTGIRHDAWANAHRIPTEEVKPISQRGLYLNPVEQGKPVSLGIGYARRQKLQARN